MRKDGKYRFTLQFSADSEDQIRVGELLENLGNRKSTIIVLALSDYIKAHPELQSGHTYSRAVGIGFIFTHEATVSHRGVVIYQTVRHQIDLLLDVDKALSQFENLSWEKHKLKQLDAGIEIQEEAVRKNNTLRLGIYEDLREGLLDRAEYESLKIELAERIDEATAAIEKLNKEKREILDGVSKQQSWVEQFRQYENVTELTRPMVIHLIERINIFEDSNIEIVFRHRNQIEEILQFISEKTADKKLLAMPIREVG